MATKPKKAKRVVAMPKHHSIDWIENKLKWVTPISMMMSLAIGAAIGDYRLKLVEAKVVAQDTKLAEILDDQAETRITSAKGRERFEQVERDTASMKSDMKEIRLAIGLLQLQLAKVCVKLKCD